MYNVMQCNAFHILCEHSNHLDFYHLQVFFALSFCSDFLLVFVALSLYNGKS